MSIKPIIFNTDMVKAILDGRKTVTRRAAKPQPENDATVTSPPYQPGDILYIRETWNICNMDAEENEIVFIYRAGEREEDTARTVRVPDEMFEKYEYSMTESNPDWRPSVHMPKEAARIWLRVTDVRAERLQDITDEQAKSEGANWKNGKNVGWEEKLKRTAIDRFSEIWDSTIKKTDIERYGWDANPWVWVIEFEKCEKPELLEV